jgi:nucleotidyltransferase/DNA polymerase involved in DNA repair
VAAISQETREAVETDLRTRWGLVGLRVIADAHGISESSVRNIARRAGIGSEGARAQSKNATEQLKADNARRREALSARLLNAAERFLDDVDANRGTIVTGISFGEVVARDIGMLTPRDAQALMTAAGIAFDKHRMLDTYDQDRDTTEVGKFLRALAGEA